MNSEADDTSDWSGISQKLLAAPGKQPRLIWPRCSPEKKKSCYFSGMIFDKAIIVTFLLLFPVL